MLLNLSSQEYKEQWYTSPEAGEGGIIKENDSDVFTLIIYSMKLIYFLLLFLT
jgi:hypothetical protein